MDELNLFRDFRSRVAGPTSDAEVRASLRLVEAIESGQGRARRRARRVPGHSWPRTALAVMIVVAVAATALFAETPWRSSPGFLERAQAALTLPEGQILHAKWELTRTSHEFGCVVTLGPNELWADLTSLHQYRWIDHNSIPVGLVDRRAIACAGDATAEIGGAPSGSLKFVPPNRLVTNGPGFTGPSLDEVSNLRNALTTGRAETEGRTELNGREVVRIRVECADPPCKGPPDYWYVDPETFLPVQFEFPHGYSIRPPVGGWLNFEIVGRYVTYEYLPRTAANLALTDIRAQHPSAGR